jgi:hypothetical protein
MGEIEGAYQVSAHRFSGTAREKIEGAGGVVTVLSGEKDQGAVAAAAEPAAEAAQESAPEAEETEEASAPKGEGASEAEEEKA